MGLCAFSWFLGQGLFCYVFPLFFQVDFLGFSPVFCFFKLFFLLFFVFSLFFQVGFLQKGSGGVSLCAFSWFLGQGLFCYVFPLFFQVDFLGFSPVFCFFKLFFLLFFVFSLFFQVGFLQKGSGGVSLCAFSWFLGQGLFCYVFSLFFQVVFLGFLLFFVFFKLFFCSFSVIPCFSNKMPGGIPGFFR